jgi:hypothetical protein
VGIHYCDRYDDGCGVCVCVCVCVCVLILGAWLAEGILICDEGSRLLGKLARSAIFLGLCSLEPSRPQVSSGGQLLTKNHAHPPSCTQAQL